jgi:hypothetical protein
MSQMLEYKLDELGWYQFERLVQSLIKAKLGLGIESWGGRGDNGRDAFFSGDLEFPKKGQLTKGPFIFQMKFVTEANATGAKPDSALLTAVTTEIDSLKKRGLKSGNVGYYVLITNVPLSTGLREKVGGKLVSSGLVSCGISLMGGKDICDWLNDSPHIRQSYPQLLGVRDLQSLLAQVVAKPILERSTLAIESASDIAKVFYPTQAYSKTLQVLEKNHFAVIEGPPEVGKTAIARMVGLAQLSLQWEVYECLSPDDFYQVYNGEATQVFIADDAFGSTEYDPARSDHWANELDRILRRIDQKHWFIWTARKHILGMALQRMRLQGKAEKFPQPADIIVDAAEISEKERALILYRHAKAVGLEDIARQIIKNNWPIVVNNRYFTPERVRRFVGDGLPKLVRGVQGGELSAQQVAQEIEREIEDPTTSMKQSFYALPVQHRKFLLSMLDIDGIGDEEKTRSAYVRHTAREGLPPFDSVLGELSSAFVRVEEW